MNRRLPFHTEFYPDHLSCVLPLGLSLLMNQEPISKSLHKVSQHIWLGIHRETSVTSLIVFLLKIPTVEEKGEKDHGERNNGFVPLRYIF